MSDDLERGLRERRDRMRSLQAIPGIGRLAVGVREDDARLWRLGRERLRPHLEAVRAGRAAAPADGPDVYVASRLYRAGGHTALIGDFVRALDGPEPGRSHLIVTGVEAPQGEPVDDDARRRTGLRAERVAVLPGPGLAERLDQLGERLRALRPARLFLFHHPADPVACAAAQPELAPARLLVHHADAVPAFGLHLPGVRVIDLNPVAAATSRLLGVPAELLLLTAPDPGPRPHGFLRRGALVTATCGAAHKYGGEYVLGYADTVAAILRATGGRHVHLGPLGEPMLAAIAAALDETGLPAEGFVHVPWVPSLARALWEYDCDVYVSSFPVDGARANAEVAASATPHLRHRLHARREPFEDRLGLRGGLVWHAWEDLAATLRRAADRGFLEERSVRMRASYEALHHPEVFRATLEGILRGDDGVCDPHADARERQALRALARTLVSTAEGLARGGAPGEGSPVALADALSHQTRRIDFLQERRRRLEDRVRALESGRGLRGAFARMRRALDRGGGRRRGS